MVAKICFFCYNTPERKNILEIIKNLNEEQLLPVLQTEGAVLVTAGAGSGKTRLLTHRIAYLIEEKKVYPFNILAITFTNKAANEMKERIAKMIGEGNSVWISTFHALCVRILRRDIEKLGFTKSFSIYSEDEKSRILKEIFAELQIDDDTDKKTITSHISRAKNNNLSPDDYTDEVVFEPLADEIIQCYRMYQAKLKKSNALDFDDLLIQTFILLKSFPDVLDYYQNIFQYIHVDEFQDTNKVQYDIVKMLAGKWKNIMVVGDEDQCIYGWRGANIENIMNFQKDFKDVKIFKLQQNYRSTKKIIELANTVISKNTSRLKKTLWTNNQDGSEVQLFTARNDKEEAEIVCRKVADLIRNKGYSANEISILMRLNALSRNFESALNNAGIAYKVLGGYKFYERAEIKNVVAYLRLLTNPFDEESLLRIINFPKRGIGENSIVKLRQVAPNSTLLGTILNVEDYPEISGALKTKLLGFAELYRNLMANIDMPVADFVKFLIKEVDFRSAYDTTDEDDLTRVLNIESFAESVSEYQKDNPNTTLDEYLQSVMLLTDLDSADLQENSVLLSTVHAVKGLEFRVVFIVGVEEGIFPIVRCGECDAEEERRLMYVAITRAKEDLYITNSRVRMLWGREQFQKPSRFLQESGLLTNKSNYAVQKNSNLAAAPSFQKTQKDFSLFKKGTKVFHSTFGVGIITDDSDLENSKMVTVTFDVLGAKKLSLEYAPLQIMKR